MNIKEKLNKTLIANHINKGSAAPLYVQRFVRIADFIVTFFIFIAIISLLVYIGLRVYDLIFRLTYINAELILFEIALIIVLVKAYKLLLYYLEHHHVSIRYIIEISIIAPAVEIIFAPARQSLAINILFGAFSLINLIIYLIFFKKLTKADEECWED